MSLFPTQIVSIQSLPLVSWVLSSPTARVPPNRVKTTSFRARPLLPYPPLPCQFGRNRSCPTSTMSSRARSLISRAYHGYRYGLADPRSYPYPRHGFAYPPLPPSTRDNDDATTAPRRSLVLTHLDFTLTPSHATTTTRQRRQRLAHTSSSPSSPSSFTCDDNNHLATMTWRRAPTTRHRHDDNDNAPSPSPSVSLPPSPSSR